MMLRTETLFYGVLEAGIEGIEDTIVPLTVVLE